MLVKLNNYIKIVGSSNSENLKKQKNLINRSITSLFCIANLLLIGISINSPVYGVQEDALEVRKKAIYDAEWKFSEAVIKIKQDYKKIANDPNVDAKAKAQANAIKNKAIADAKVIKDKAITDARQAYDLAIKSKALAKDKSGNSQKQPFCFLWWCW